MRHLIRLSMSIKHCEVSVNCVSPVLSIAAEERESFRGWRRELLSVPGCSFLGMKYVISDGQKLRGVLITNSALSYLCF